LDVRFWLSLGDWQKPRFENVIVRRLAEFADETCLSQGDLLRVTEDAIDTKTGIIRLNFGRGKTGVEAGSSP
jgi:hypothetical protein